MKRIIAIIAAIIFIQNYNLYAQYVYKWLSVGAFTNMYSAIGSEPEEGNSSYAYQQAGFIWPTLYKYQDMQCAKALWIATTNYLDVNGKLRQYKISHVGPRVSGAGEFFPIEHKLIYKNDRVFPRVDLAETFNTYYDIPDEIDPNLDCDAMVYTKVNTSVGITVERKVKAWMHPYLDNFHIIEYTFTNTGLISNDNTTKRDDRTLTDVYFYFQNRMSVVREIRYFVGNSSGWGVNTMNDARWPNDGNTDNPKNLRFWYFWHGKYMQFGKPTNAPADWDNIGAPIYQPDPSPYYIPRADTNWRLGAIHFGGTLVLHADKSTTDRSDDPDQPRTMDWISSDDNQLTRNQDHNNEALMAIEWAAITRGRRVPTHAAFIEPTKNYVKPTNDPSTGSTNGAGYSYTMGFGPYTMAPGESIKIVLAEGADGLSRQEAVEWGLKYKKGQITTLQKNQKVFEGKDRLFATFERIKEFYDNYVKNNNQNYPKPPLPPTDFNVYSQGGRIKLTWNVYPQAVSETKGFRIYRSRDVQEEGYPLGEYTVNYDMIAQLPASAREYIDTAVKFNVNYFYYITAIGDPVPANPALGIPAGVLESQRLATQIYRGATKKTPGAPTVGGVVVVPNPYIISADASNLLFPGEPNKIAFVNVPGECQIKIYTELGELIKTIDHKDGSGSAFWYQTTSSNQYIASGIYIAVITDTKNGKQQIVKFTIIR